jgi:hypothetical protein
MKRPEDELDNVDPRGEDSVIIDERAASLLLLLALFCEKEEAT